MNLITLGRLQLCGPDRPVYSGQPQALLVLAYLALEGPTERSHLAELFWPHARRPRNNLSSALSRLRSVDRSLIQSDAHLVTASVDVDAARFFDHALAGDDSEALRIYQGRFAYGCDLTSCHWELEEWILDRREALASSARNIALRLALEEQQLGNTTCAVRLAEFAFRVGSGAIPDPDHYDDLVGILTPGYSAMHSRVRREAEEHRADHHTLNAVRDMNDALGWPTAEVS